MRRIVLGAALAAVVSGVVAVVALSACNDANDVAGCRQLEDARCEHALQCGIDPGFPLHAGGSDADFVTACKEFYQDACLHGFVTTIDITPDKIASCYQAINSGNCNYVLNPQLAPGCSWIIPPDAGIDAGVDAVATSTTTVAVSSASVADAGVDSAYADCNQQCEETCDNDPGCIELCPTMCSGQ